MGKNCKIHLKQILTISKGKFKSKEQKIALENIKLLYKSRETAIKFFSDYSSIISGKLQLNSW